MVDQGVGLVNYVKSQTNDTIQKARCAGGCIVRMAGDVVAWRTWATCTRHRAQALHEEGAVRGAWTHGDALLESRYRWPPTGGDRAPIWGFMVARRAVSDRRSGCGVACRCA